MRYFFASSASFARQLTQLYDVINPAAAAMWNLRWQVRGYVAERASVDNDELHGRFVAGSGIGSANLKRHCLEEPWDKQTSELALLAMYAGISLYEGWTATLEVGTPQQRNRLQFPSRGTARHVKDGAAETLAAVGTSRSADLEAIYGRVLRANRKYMPDRLEDLLLAYRCYKEARNSCAHAGRIANSWAEGAFTDAEVIAGGLGARGRPLSLPKLEEGKPALIRLQDVQGLWAVMLALVTTLDATLATTKEAETSFRSRWKASHQFKTLSGDTARRHTQLNRLSLNAGFPKASDPGVLYEFLRRDHLVI
ncbi:hypothetical protein [Nocardioides sp. NPDC004968]|uniref:hypothetical protein n=1 Tax=Nocardioides sp. NPDC004968 TaxID=3155894 RepID=UPI0033BBBB3B